MQLAHLFLVLVLIINALLWPFAQKKSPRVAVSLVPAMHQVAITDADNTDYCTAYSVGPTTILIARHCIGKEPDHDLFEFAEGAAVADSVILETPNRDHAIIHLKFLDIDQKAHRFSSWIDASKRRDVLTVGTKVHFWGAPKRINCDACYREGYFSGYGVDDDGGPLLWFVLESIPGDSGSLIFDDAGLLVGEVTYGYPGMTGVKPFAFTPDQWKEAR